MGGEKKEKKWTDRHRERDRSRYPRGLYNMLKKISFTKFKEIFKILMYS